MMMQRVLSHTAWWRGAAVRSVLLGVPAPPGQTTFCCCVLRLAQPPPAGRCWLSASTFSKATLPTGRRWLSASTCSKAAHNPKPPPDEPPQPGVPQTQTPGDGDAAELDPLQDNSIGLYQRFKRMFKQYGKVMIPAHLLTSTVWFGTFYYAAMKGINVVPFLELMGLPESVVGVLRESSSGYLLTAYAMYKIATPARYTVTLGTTSLCVQYLRKHGYFSTPPTVKEYFQDRIEENKEKLTERMEETKERLSEKMEETKELFSDRMEETKDRLSEKMGETKDKLSEKVSGGKSLFRKKSD